MILQLMVKGYCVAEEEVVFQNDSRLSFEENCKMKETYVSLIIKKMKSRYQHYLEIREYEFVLTVQSKMNKKQILIIT